MAYMNGFEKHGLDDNTFGPKSGLDTLKTFDAFRKLPSASSDQKCSRSFHLLDLSP